MRIKVLAIAAAFVLGGLCPLGWFAARPDRGHAVTPPGRPVWNEVAWPFLMDQWGKGKAFQCKPADCGTEVNLYLRAKIGFCNCTTGVSDDDELSRVGDIGIIGGNVSPLAPGRAITVASMKGRSRPYVVAKTFPSAESALEMALNEHCDAVVATVIVARGAAAPLEQPALDFLASDVALRWAERTLGL
ncbi:MAG: hypothetical protein JO328_05730 [Hyphomicrobiales bacterium]|nr:hypothetical protein [Hyphomicrobiales bacterium]MBV8826697.1 hypothetical protein [Hyphomicrobiales bacterium]MBV9429506.1 hypothetical protein [Bradyrhizobiaceae bacterium]